MIGIKLINYIYGHDKQEIGTRSIKRYSGGVIYVIIRLLLQLVFHNPKTMTHIKTYD